MAMKIQKGFTIVELLIVIVVVAILAAVSIVAYQGIQSSAHDAAIRSDFRAIANLLELYRIDHGGYPHNPAGNLGSGSNGSCNPDGVVIYAALGSVKMKLSTGSYDTTLANTNLLYLASNDGEKYALLGYARGNPTYYITNNSTVPQVYDNSGPVVTRYPGGSACAGIADNIGISAPGTHEDFAYYNIFIRGSGGFRVWN